MAHSTADAKKRGSAWDAMLKFANLYQPQPLSPIWNLYITKIWQPAQQSYLDDYREGMAPDIGKEEMTVCRRGTRLSAFDMSDSAVNVARAKHFLATLAALRNIFGRAAWLPVSESALIQAIVEEQSEKDKSPGRVQVRSNVDPFLSYRVLVWLNQSEEDPELKRILAKYHGPQRAHHRHEAKKDTQEAWSTAATAGRSDHASSGAVKRKRPS